MAARTVHPLRYDPSMPFDPGEVTMRLLRRFEPQGKRGRRQFLATLAMMAGGAPVMAQQA